MPPRLLSSPAVESCRPGPSQDPSRARWKRQQENLTKPDIPAAIAKARSRQAERTALTADLPQKCQFFQVPFRESCAACRIRVRHYVPAAARIRLLDKTSRLRIGIFVEKGGLGPLDGTRVSIDATGAVELVMRALKKSAAS